MDKIFKQGQEFAKKLHTEEIVPKDDIRKEILEKPDWLYALYDQHKEEERLALEKKKKRKTPKKQRRAEGEQVVYTTLAGSLDNMELKALQPQHCQNIILKEPHA